MRKAILISILLASSIACTGCGNGGGDGTGGTGGGGSDTALSFDAQTALPATGAAAIAMEFSAAIGETFAAVFQAIDLAPLAAPLRATPKIDLPVSGACPGGGTVSVDQTDDVITVNLTDCVGTGIAADPVSGDATLTIKDPEPGSDGLQITADATLDLKVGADATVVGNFIASVDLARFGQIHLRLGDALDDEVLRVTESGQTVLLLGCFDFRLAFEQLAGALQLFRITPYGVASLRNPEEMKNEVFTINDYTPRVTGIGRSINFDDDGLPGSGDMTLVGGDHSGADTDRADQGKTLCLLGEAGDTSVTATFSAGGCVDLQGVNRDGPFQNSTTWDKLIDRDFTSGGGGSCGGGGTGGSGVPTTDATPSPVQCFMGNDIVADADAYIRGNGSAGEFDMTSFGNASNLLIKSVPDLSFARKIYIVFDLTSFSDSFSKASLVLTLERHVEAADPTISGPQPVDVYGITANPDWDPAMLAEDAITWDNAPRNDKIAPNRFEMTPDVPLLIAGYDFDLGGDGVIDVPGTKYALDITEYVTERLANDSNRKITILMAIPTGTPVEGSAFRSLDIPDEDMCDRPFLHFE